MREDHFSREVLPGRGDPHAVGNSRHQRHGVGQHQRLDAGLLSDLAGLLCRGVGAQDMGEQLLRVARDCRAALTVVHARIARLSGEGGGLVGIGVDRLMHQHVAALGKLDHALHR